MVACLPTYLLTSGPSTPSLARASQGYYVRSHACSRFVLHSRQPSGHRISSCCRPFYLVRPPLPHTATGSLPAALKRKLLFFDPLLNLSRDEAGSVTRRSKCTGPRPSSFHLSALAQTQVGVGPQPLTTLRMLLPSLEATKHRSGQTRPPCVAAHARTPGIGTLVGLCFPLSQGAGSLFAAVSPTLASQLHHSLSQEPPPASRPSPGTQQLQHLRERTSSPLFNSRRRPDVPISPRLPVAGHARPTAPASARPLSLRGPRAQRGCQPGPTTAIPFTGMDA